MDLSLGNEHTCLFILARNATKCFGNGLHGRLGNESPLIVGDISSEMGNALKEINYGTGRVVRTIAVGGKHTCAILDNWYIKCHGYNQFGQLGYGDIRSRGSYPNEMGDNLPAVSIGGNNKVYQLALGEAHTCVLIDGGFVKCFGYGDRGQLGYGNDDTIGSLPGEMGDNLPIVRIHATSKVQLLVSGPGAHHNCVILEKATVKCWGYNGYGQLGYGDTNDRGDRVNEMGSSLPEVFLGPGRTSKQISVGALHTCTILDNNTAKCWGHNIYGQLGYGDTVRRGDNGNEMGSALPSIILGTGRYPKIISAGGSFTCALLDNDKVKCWGANEAGQLGYGDTKQRGDNVKEMADFLPEIDLGTDTTPLKVITGVSHVCVLFIDAFKCWGNNYVAQLGLGDLLPRGSAPGQMGNALPFVDYGKGTPLPTSSPHRRKPSPKPTTLKPTKSPKISPTTRSPTYKPTTTPSTGNPTQVPTTRKPTIGPTKSPTQSPFFSFFGSADAAAKISSLDLYILVDKSGVTNDLDDACKTVGTISGAASTSCLDLMFDYSWEIIKRISAAIGYYKGIIGTLDKGLRVAILAFACNENEAPVSIDVISSLTGNEMSIKNAIGKARADLEASGKACPDIALGRIVRKVEDSWSTSNSRPFKMMLTFTSGIFDSSINIIRDPVSNLYLRCTPSITVSPDVGAKYLTPTSKKLQKTGLNAFTNKNKKSQFEMTGGEASTIADIGKQMGTLLLLTTKNSKCSDPAIYSDSSSFWCGYTTSSDCLDRTSCTWNGGENKCMKQE